MDATKVIDATVESWSEVHPEIDFAGMGVMLKLTALTHRINKDLSAFADSCGITPGEFDVLATLRRHGPRAKLTPSYIAEVALVSPSGLTHRLTQLEKAGHIARLPDPNDRRSFLISITPSGSALADRIVKYIAEASTVFLDDLGITRFQPFVRDVELLLQSISREKIHAPSA